MSEKTQEWAERVGRESADLGMPWQIGMTDVFTGLTVVDFNRDGAPLFGGDPDTGLQRLTGPIAPDFRGRLTELACIAWVHDVALEVYGDVAVLFDFDRGRVNVTIGEKIRALGRCFFDETHDTLAEACIAAVRATKGGEA